LPQGVCSVAGWSSGQTTSMYWPSWSGIVKLRVPKRGWTPPSTKVLPRREPGRWTVPASEWGQSCEIVCISKTKVSLTPLTLKGLRLQNLVRYQPQPLQKSWGSSLSLTRAFGCKYGCNTRI
jgi:hypothetical protein